ncbi:MAG TPA: YceI family protein [Saprospiraceae bacterium]|nr:YceI family protein [Saprospiraceae bacterium]HPI07437.1 YceI family protein [Saprospiraceae bacterium]
MFSDKFRWTNWLVFFVAGVIMVAATTDHTSAVKKRYQILEGSKLYLKGTSNVNNFTCDCENRYGEQMVEVDRNGGYARFKNVDLTIPTKRFDCHNRKIDNDMQKALQADQHPNIRIKLVDAQQNAKCLEGDCKDWFDVKARVNITITGVSKEHTIAAKARTISPNRFELRGEQALQMSTFGINPPEAMFGLIKVNDWISFHFNLIVDVGEIQ